MIELNKKYGCLTVLDNGEEYENSEKYKEIKEEYNKIVKKHDDLIDILKNTSLDNEHELERKIFTLKREIFILNCEANNKLLLLERHYKCKCKCGKIHFFNQETIENNPKYCYYPIPISKKYTYSIKARNATKRKEERYKKKENVILLDKNECVPSDNFCERYNIKRVKDLLKKEENLTKEIASIPRENALNYDKNFEGLQYESLFVNECINNHFESKPNVYFSQSHKKCWHNIKVYKQYKCTCDLCGKEYIFTCDKFGVYPPTEYGYHAYNGYWSEVKCDCHPISSFQWIVTKLLIENNVKYKVEYSFSDLYGTYGKNLLRYDFAIFNMDGTIKYLIECQGEQHFNPVEEFKGIKGYEVQIKNDQLKRDYAKIHNIPLLEISYKDKKYETIKNILIKYNII